MINIVSIFAALLTHYGAVAHNNVVRREVTSRGDLQVVLNESAGQTPIGEPISPGICRDFSDPSDPGCCVGNHCVHLSNDGMATGGPLSLFEAWSGDDYPGQDGASGAWCVCLHEYNRWVATAGVTSGADVTACQSYSVSSCTQSPPKQCNAAGAGDGTG